MSDPRPVPAETPRPDPLGAIPYLVILLIPLGALATLAAGGWATIAVPVVVFGLVPLLESWSWGTRRNLDAGAEAGRRAALWAYDLVVFAAVGIHLLLVGAMIAGVAAGRWSGAELIGVVITVGTSCGAIGINLGHELGHRAARLHAAVARVALASSLYAHFYIEHNRGHHARVATPDDPASAPRGEVVYAFWLRSITGGLRSAWQLEARRLAAAGLPAVHPRNEVLTGGLAQAALVLAVGLAAGPVGAAAFLGSALMGILLLETINYVEHYGLSRKQLPGGRYERVTPAHSWTTDRPLGRVLLFELTRHADHHAHAGRPYPLLRHMDDAPELPQGYPAMLLLALVPPLWFRVMDPRVDAELSRLGRAAA